MTTDIIKSHDKRYEKYEALLLKRDNLRREAGSIWTAYLKELGQRITDVFELKIECISLKKSIEFCQAAINRGELPDQSKLDKYIAQSMAEYYENLKNMIKERDDAIASKTVSPYVVTQCKKVYRQIAKEIHTDLHPELAGNEDISELWNRTTVAYGQLDIRELKELAVLVELAIKQLTNGEINIEIPDVEERIIELEEAIEKIRNTEPYIYKKLIEDEIELEGRKTQLDQEFEEYRAYRDELRLVLSEIEFADAGQRLS